MKLRTTMNIDYHLLFVGDLEGVTHEDKVAIDLLQEELDQKRKTLSKLKEEINQLTLRKNIRMLEYLEKQKELKTIFP